MDKGTVTVPHHMGMDVRLHDSVDDFRSVAVEIYERAPVAATVELTVLRRDLPDSDPAPLLLTVCDGGALVGAALQTPPFPLLCCGLPESAIGDVVAELARSRPGLNGVRGPRGKATRFAAAWCKITGVLSRVILQERLYRLEALRPPMTVEGEPRAANHDDTGTLVDWLDRFHAEAFGSAPQPAASAQSIQAAKEAGDELLLWVLDGHPVSMAAVRSPAAGVSRIGPVYTPIDKRGNGFGSAVAAAAAAWAREARADEVVLFADLANPVSNAIYHRIGFLPIGQRFSTYRFHRTDVASGEAPGSTEVSHRALRKTRRT